jgi:hypothetical protein
MTYLFLTILVVLLHKFLNGSRWILAWTPLLMVVWVNSHGGFLAGIGIYGAVAGIEWLRGLITGEKHGWTLMIFFLLSCLATLINPEGYKLHAFLYQSLSLPRDIGEWNPVPLFDTSYLAYKTLCLMFLVSLIFPGRKRIWEIAIIVLAVVYGFKHQRHTLLAAIVMTPYLSLKLAGFVNHLNFRSITSRLTTPSHVILQISILLFAAGQIYTGSQPYQLNDFKIMVEPRHYPVHAVRFMKDNGINGNIAVPFDWGEYLIWKLPKSRVSIDGRFRTAYPEKVIQQNKVFTEGQPGWQDLLREADIVMTRQFFPNEKLLDGNTDWLLIYNDGLVRIYIRKTDPPGPIESRHYNKELIDDESPVSIAFP